MGAEGETHKTNADFLRYCLKRVWMAEGASEEHADAVANALLIGIRQRKLNQGLGVYEAIDLTKQMGLAAMENASIPMGRPAEPGEIANAIGFFTPSSHLAA